MQGTVFWCCTLQWNCCLLRLVELKCPLACASPTGWLGKFRSAGSGVDQEISLCVFIGNIGSCNCWEGKRTECQHQWVASFEVFCPCTGWGTVACCCTEIAVVVAQAILLLLMKVSATGSRGWGELLCWLGSLPRLQLHWYLCCVMRHQGHWWNGQRGVQFPLFSFLWHWQGRESGLADVVTTSLAGDWLSGRDLCCLRGRWEKAWCSFHAVLAFWPPNGCWESFRILAAQLVGYSINCHRRNTFRSL